MPRARTSTLNAEHRSLGAVAESWTETTSLHSLCRYGFRQGIAHLLACREANRAEQLFTHFGANTWGHGTGTEGGLYACAHPLMDALRAAGVALDLSHASDQTFWQIMDYWDGPVHASHCMCRALVPSQRHLSDEMIRALAGRGGVIGMVFAEPMLDSRWTYEDPATHHPVARRAMVAVIDHVDHICQLTGSCDHVAIGSDLDGGFGRELAPTDCETIADLQRFPGMLARRGYTEENIAAIAHGNLLRFFRQAWSGT